MAEEQDKQSASTPATPRIRITSTAPGTVKIGGASDAAKKSTTRIELSGSDLAAAAKKQTSRIDLKTVLQAESAAPAKPAAAAPGAPKTIRIRRDGMAAPVPVVPVPEEPGTGIQDQPEPAVIRKSETSRIELPAEVAEQPPTQKKTIRIKRPEGAGGKPVVITSGGGATSMVPAALQRAPSRKDEDEPGSLYGALALVAALLLIVVLYVLIGQVGTAETLAPSRLPYFGQL